MARPRKNADDEEMDKSQYRLIQLRTPEPIYEWLRSKSFYERRSMNELVNEALERFAQQEAPTEGWRRKEDSPVYPLILSPGNEADRGSSNEG
jgi:hypothetical protein